MRVTCQRLLLLLLLVLAMVRGTIQAPLQPQSRDGDVASILKSRLFGFYVNYGLCTQTEWCNEGGYFEKVASGCPSTCDPAKTFESTLGKDGSWPDVAYNNSSPSIWQPFAHLERTASMIRSYHCKACSQFRNAGILTASRSALAFWLKNDFQCPNWWWNEIGTPGTLGAILMMLTFADGGMTSAELQGALPSLNRALNGTGSGENLVWTQQVAINRELLKGNINGSGSIFDKMWSAVQQTSSDGVQVDSSFHFHGPLLYTGGYGGDFVLNLAVYANLTVGTPFAPQGTPLDVLVGYLLDGQQYAVRTGPKNASGQPSTRWDVSVKGREIVRAPDGNLVFPAVMSQVIAPLSSIYPQRADELKAFAAQLQGNGQPFSGTRHFFRSDYTAHHRPAFAVTLKMHSTRTLNNEVTNGEGLRSWHTASGATLFYNTGAEYSGIFPVWNWTKIPGTTTRHSQHEDSSKVHQMGSTDFVGGCTDGQVAVSAMDFKSLDFGGPTESTPITAHKSWYFVEEGVLAVMTDAMLSVDGVEVTTTLDQTLQQTSVVADGSTVADGNHSLTVSWVWHNNFLYSFPAATPALIGVGDAQGAWDRISEEGDNTTVHRRVVTVESSQGVAPKDASLTYAVLGGVSQRDAATAHKVFWQKASVVSSVKGAHAVLYARSDSVKTLFVTAWQPSATVDAGPGFQITVSDPCVFIMHADSSKHQVQFFAANPANAGLRVTVTVDRPLQGSGDTVSCSTTGAAKATVTLNTPSGSFAGSTINGTCTV